ncbi:alpha/beta fold hydrolase [Nocardioides sp. MAH-18]|uniref:Alpha/beta fold hydrolase n=1 Tax=Nocardioides agri TaxID=2682843 RepID=A0A6L6XVS2_9ACTN|nr:MULTISPECIES: alpha/beta hydrolase [unclassified Nocardioides]MBA2955927.1 alpha/beta hydrolase [Nocardioides sp. CGMCC 1.13656]MVQ50777.1 alpha/beta fold hydrolase [Nocardioides sp. MAH-18]
MSVDIALTTPDGVRLAAVLRPGRGDGPRPAVALTGPFTGVKEQVLATYAEGLAARGVTTLAFDHRNFGASGGTPRQHEDPGGKLTDLQTAVSALLDRDDVTRVGLLGICLGAGYALKAAAFDGRVEALVTVAGAYNSPQAMQAGFGAEAYRSKLAELLAAAGTTIPAVARTGPAAMPGEEPFAYYGTERGAVPGWRNEVTTASIHALLTLDAAIGADFLAGTPFRIVHGTRDDYCSPEAAQAVYDRVEGPRDLIWLETTDHIDLYDRPAYVEPALDACADWFHRHLS